MTGIVCSVDESIGRLSAVVKGTTTCTPGRITDPAASPKCTATSAPVE